MAARLHRNEYMGMVGGALLAVGVFLPWYATDASNRFANIDGARGSQSCFDVHPILRWLLLAAAVAPFILAYIIARGHDLTWRPGEVTMIVGITAFALILVNGIILGRPGGDDPHNVDISIEIGYWIGMLGSVCIAFGGFVRQSRGVRSKPPGVM